MTTPVQKNLVAKNSEYVSAFDKGDLALPPAKKYLVVTCMDARIDPAAAYGIDLGDAHVIRNAGGSVKDALRSIVISEQLLGTTEIVVVKHTGCGMLTFSNNDIHGVIEKNLGSEAAVEGKQIDFLPFPELEQAVRDDVAYLKSSKLVPDSVAVSGWVYAVETGKLRLSTDQLGSTIYLAYHTRSYTSNICLLKIAVPPISMSAKKDLEETVCLRTLRQRLERCKPSLDHLQKITDAVSFSIGVSVQERVCLLYGKGPVVESSPRNSASSAASTSSKRSSSSSSSSKRSLIRRISGVADPKIATQTPTARQERVADSQTLFAVSSIAEGFLARLVELLVKKGKLSWTAPVTDYLPLPEPWGSVCLRDLLAHNTKCVPPTDAAYSLHKKIDLDEDTFYKTITFFSEKFLIEPREAEHSVWAYAIVTQIVEKVCKWNATFNRGILKPLGLTRTTFSSARADEAGNIALPFADGVQLVRHQSDSTSLFPQLYSCVDDLLVWGYHLLQSRFFVGHGRLPPELDPRNDSHTGLGWFSVRTPTIALSYGSGNHGMLLGAGGVTINEKQASTEIIRHNSGECSLSLVPELAAVVVVLCNSPTFADYASQLLLQELLQMEPKINIVAEARKPAWEIEAWQATQNLPAFFCLIDEAQIGCTLRQIAGDYHSEIRSLSILAHPLMRGEGPFCSADPCFLDGSDLERMRTKMQLLLAFGDTDTDTQRIPLHPHARRWECSPSGLCEIEEWTFLPNEGAYHALGCGHLAPEQTLLRIHRVRLGEVCGISMPLGGVTVFFRKARVL